MFRNHEHLQNVFAFTFLFSFEALHLCNITDRPDSKDKKLPYMQLTASKKALTWTTNNWGLDKHWYKKFMSICVLWNEFGPSRRNMFRQVVQWMMLVLNNNCDLNTWITKKMEVIYPPFNKVMMLWFTFRRIPSGVAIANQPLLIQHR